MKSKELNKSYGLRRSMVSTLLQAMYHQVLQQLRNILKLNKDFEFKSISLTSWCRVVRWSVISNWLMWDGNSRIWHANIMFWHRTVWRINSLGIVTNLLQISIRPQNILMFRSNCRGNDSCSIVVGNSSVTDGDKNREYYKLKNDIAMK
jgi:hypothetical protein